MDNRDTPRVSKIPGFRYYASAPPICVLVSNIGFVCTKNVYCFLKFITENKYPNFGWTRSQSSTSLLLLQLLTSCTPQIGTFEYQTWLKCFRNWDMIFNYRLFMALEMEFLICSNVHLSLFLAMTFSNFAISNPIQFQYQNWFENDFFLLLNVIWRKTILSDEIL